MMKSGAQFKKSNLSKGTGINLLAITAILLGFIAAAPIGSASPQCPTIDEKYAQLGGSSGFLGKPTTGEVDVQFDTPYPNGRYRNYERGSIYWTPDLCAYEIHGPIRNKWASVGWEAGWLGYPKTDTKETPDGLGQYNNFTGGGTIYWTPSTGAHIISGPIRDFWYSNMIS